MLNKTKDYITRNRLWPIVDVLIFVVITGGFHKLYWAFFSVGISQSGMNAVMEWLAATVYSVSAWVDVHIFGMDILLYPVNMIHFNANNTTIAINESCSGFKQMLQVLILFLLFPGPWKHKLWYIPAGMLAMFITNIIRVVILSAVMIHWPQQWDFIHLWILRPFYYVVIFGLWVLWVERFGGMRKFIRADH